MKKSCFLFILFFCFFFSGLLKPCYIYANDGVIWGGDIEEDVEEPILSSHIKSRKFEVGLANIKVGFANNFISIRDVFQKKMIIDIDGLQKGLGMNLGVNFYPFFFNYNKDNIWGAGFSLGVETVGIINLSEKLLSFSEADNDKSDVSGAVFIEARYNGFFHVEKIKIKIRPALYYPLMYISPDISYTYRNTSEGTIIDLGYNVRAYTAFPLEGSFVLTAFPGLDFHLGAEYPLSEVLGLKEILSFLDFDVGLDMINIPLVPAVMKNYMEISGRIGNDIPIDFFGEGGFESFSTDSETVYGTERKLVLRPFKMISWIDWRPFKIVPVSFFQSFGFALSPFYSQPFSLETGIRANFHLRNNFIASLGIGYYDRLWKNSLDLVLNFRIFELDLGVELCSQDFTKSWTGTGFGLGLGVKVGW